MAAANGADGGSIVGCAAVFGLGLGADGRFFIENTGARVGAGDLGLF